MGWITEKSGRLKPNGELRGHSPLTPLIELEGLSLGIEGKRSLWLALAAVDAVAERIGRDRLGELIARAEDQRARVEVHRRRDAARRAFAARSGRASRPTRASRRSTAAFARRAACPPDAELLHERCFDDNDIAALYGVAHWRELDDATIEREYAALSFLSPARLPALHPRLPALRAAPPRHRRRRRRLDDLEPLADALRRRGAAGVRRAPSSSRSTTASAPPRSRSSRPCASSATSTSPPRPSCALTAGWPLSSSGRAGSRRASASAGARSRAATSPAGPGGRGACARRSGRRRSRRTPRAGTSGRPR